MLSSIQKRLQREEGFTLIELLVVIIIIGILLAIAVPSYLGFRDRANRSAAQSNVRAALPAIETYSADNIDPTAAGDSNPAAGTTGYEGMTVALLQAIDAGISSGLTFGALLDDNSYCVASTSGGQTFHYSVGYAANNGQVLTGACPAA